MYPFSDRNEAKTLPFGAAHTYMACIRQYPSTPPPPPPVVGICAVPPQKSLYAYIRWYVGV